VRDGVMLFSSYSGERSTEHLDRQSNPLGLAGGGRSGLDKELAAAALAQHMQR
jgi:hypothetical protein